MEDDEDQPTDQQRRVFASVFPVPSLSHTTPTPIATPDIGFTQPGQPFGAPTSHATSQHHAVRRSHAWSTATRFLALPTSRDDAARHRQERIKTAEVEDALHYLLTGEGKSTDRGEESLVDWYRDEAMLHYDDYVRPALIERWEDARSLKHAWPILEHTQRTLQEEQELCLRPFVEHILPVFAQSTFSSSATLDANDPIHNRQEVLHDQLQQDIHGLFAYSLPEPRFSKALSYALYDAGCRIFRIHKRIGTTNTTAIPEDPGEVRLRMMRLLRGLHAVGLGGDTAEKAFALSMDKLMETFVESAYLKVDWVSGCSVVGQLTAWIENWFSPLVHQVLGCLQRAPTEEDTFEIQRWQEMALGKLGRARVNQLFDFVLHWNKSLGAILDIKGYLKIPGAKQHLSAAFTQQVSKRLLHAGNPTTDILNIYVSIIRVFHELEPKGVLLERVARPIRKYLKDRSDTARVIISSLLADSSDDDGTKFQADSELSYEIAKEMQKPILTATEDADEELNWDDMNWQPLPVDASPDYKKSKVQDVIWFLLTLWDRESFITEMKSIFGDHLLRCEDPEYQKEIRLLELVKIRLGDDKLQACEVMLRDILDSKRINAAIHTQVTSAVASPGGDQTDADADADALTPSRRATRASSKLRTQSSVMRTEQPETDLSVQILSSEFWPTLRDDAFQLPSAVSALQQDFASQFEAIRGMRKLDWVPALGEATLSLDFEDRIVEIPGVMAWQASVIHAFQPAPGEEWASGQGKGKAKTSLGVTRNVQQLQEILDMDEALVRQALAFWVGNSVLKETETDTFAVIEDLRAEERAVGSTVTNKEAQAQAQAAAAGATAAVKSAADILNEKKPVYTQFILGMLTNQGNMPVQRMLMMLKMALEGGFPYGPAELESLLEGLKEEGRVVQVGGGVWGMKK